MDYTRARQDWGKTYTQGLDLLGFKYDNRTDPFPGASGATHPVLAEAVTQFQALAYKELLSDTSRLEEFATGKTINPDKAKIAKEKKEKVGKINKSTVEQAEYLETKYGPGDEGDPYYRDYSDYD